MEIIDVTGMEPGEILWQRQFVMAPDHFTQVCALVTTAKASGRVNNLVWGRL